MDSNVPHDLEERFRNIEAHLGIGKTDEDTGAYSVETHESLVPPEPDVPAPGAPQAPAAAPVLTMQEQFNAMSDEEKAAFMAENEHHEGV
jgi:hypothetical protein